MTAALPVSSSGDVLRRLLREQDADPPRTGAAAWAAFKAFALIPFDADYDDILVSVYVEDAAALVHLEFLRRFGRLDAEGRIARWEQVEYSLDFPDTDATESVGPHRTRFVPRESWSEATAGLERQDDFRILLSARPCRAQLIHENV